MNYGQYKQIKEEEFEDLRSQETIKSFSYTFDGGQKVVFSSGKIVIILNERILGRIFFYRDASAPVAEESQTLGDTPNEILPASGAFFDHDDSPSKEEIISWHGDF